MEIGVQGKLEYIQRVNAALHFMEMFYPEDIKLEDIAEAAHFSPFHFHRIFSAFTGESPGEYLRRIRLEKAAHFLSLHPEYTITRIALETGFSSSAVFARSFVGHFGISARDYRKKVGPDNVQELKFKLNLTSTITDGEARYQPQTFMDLPSMRLAYVRSMNGYGTNIGKAWNILFAWAYPNGSINEKSRLFGIPLDDPEITPKNKCRYFVSINIDETVFPSGPVEWMTVVKGKYIVFPFDGEMKLISAFYKQIYGEWLPQSGYQPDDRPFMEEYSMADTNHDPNTNKNHLRFSLLLPIKPL